MFNKYSSSLFVLTMVSTFALYSTPALSLQPISIGPNIAKQFQCPSEIQWRNTGTVLQSGLDINGLNYKTLNAADVKKTLPVKVTVGVLARPALKSSTLLSDDNYGVVHQCTYTFKTISGTVVGKSYDWILQANTGNKLNIMQIQNTADHPITVAVFPADVSGKPQSKETVVTFNVAKKGTQPAAQFLSPEKYKSSVVQVQYEGGAGYVDCGNQPNGGKYSLTFTDPGKLLPNKCEFRKSAS